MQPPKIPDLVVERLARKQIRSVYPLMQAADPSLSLARWIRYARRVAGHLPTARDGMLVARRDAAVHPCGAVCYQRVHHLRHGTILTAEHFVALDLLHPQSVLSALSAELELVALRLSCAAIRSIVHSSGAALLDHLRVAGHVREGVLLIKSLDVDVQDAAQDATKRR